MSELRDPPASDDFEWVNSWAQDHTEKTGEPSATGGQPRPDRVPAPTQYPTEIAVPPPAAAPPKAADVAPKPAITAQPSFAERVVQVSRKRAPEAEQFVHPAARRFFAALRTPSPAPPSEAATTAPSRDVPLTITAAPVSPSTTSPELSPEPAPAADVRDATPMAKPVADAAKEPATMESAETSLVPDASQLERDIAEIESARDALLEPAPFSITDPRKPRSPFAMLRNAESVPILVGSVVGVTLLIVFGAAASLISLR